MTRRMVLLSWDVVCWFLATFLLLSVRFDVRVVEVNWEAILIYCVVASLTQVVLGYALAFYRGLYRTGSFDGAVMLALIVAVAAIPSGIVGALMADFPTGTVLAAPPTALTLMMASRWIVRAISERSLANGGDEEPTSKALVYGAGYAGLQVYRLAKLANPAPFRIVGFIDDDPTKKHQRFGSSQVLGDIDHLAEVVKKVEADTLVLAISRVSGDFIKDLNRKAEALGLKLLLLPPLDRMLQGRMQGIDQLHEVDVTDLLGRPPIKTDLRAITDYLNGKVVLVTGAGGSIGSEIARQVHRFGPKELVLLDRDESALHAVQLSIYGIGLLDTRDMVLCDIRDHEALDAIFAEHKPDIVFHAAALKHFPMLEMYPAEAWKTNVLGSLNVLQCAHDHGVTRFVNISTDKAADPSTVLGQTKRRAEQLTSWFAQQYEHDYVSVRFGNVLGSRGSVLHTFRQQILAGGPVTVTDPDVERYFMTIPEACELTLQAAAIGEPSDVLVLDMGDPVRILDVAQQMIGLSGRKIDVQFTGLRPNEKITEALFSEHEQATDSSHPRIKHVQVPPMSPDDALVGMPRSAPATAEPAQTQEDDADGVVLHNPQPVAPGVVRRAIDRMLAK